MNKTYERISRARRNLLETSLNVSFPNSEELRWQEEDRRRRRGRLRRRRCGRALLNIVWARSTLRGESQEINEVSTRPFARIKIQERIPRKMSSKLMRKMTSSIVKANALTINISG